MFAMNDKVKIIKTGLVCTVVDVSTTNGETVYIVESDTPNVGGGYGGKWALFDCHAEDLARA